MIATTPRSRDHRCGSPKTTATYTTAMIAVSAPAVARKTRRRVAVSALNAHRAASRARPHPMTAQAPAITATPASQPLELSSRIVGIAARTRLTANTVKGATTRRAGTRRFTDVTGSTTSRLASVVAVVGGSPAAAGASGKLSRPARRTRMPAASTPAPHAWPKP